MTRTSVTKGVKVHTPCSTIRLPTMLLGIGQGATLEGLTKNGYQDLFMERLKHIKMAFLIAMLWAITRASEVKAMWIVL